MMTATRLIRKSNAESRYHSYIYDHFGNLIHRELTDGKVQNYFYDLHDQLVKAEISKKRQYKRDLGLHLRRLGQKDRQRPSEKRRSFRRSRMQQLLYLEKIVVPPLVQVVDLQILHH